MRRCALVLSLAAFAAGHAMAMDLSAPDVFGVMSDVPRSPSSALMAQGSAADPCELGPLGNPMSLFEAVERALCSSPRTRETWANIKEQAAQVGQSEAAFLPTMNASLVAAHDHGSTFYDAKFLSDVADRIHYDSGTLAFNWVLFDFGSRWAARNNARQMLLAAEANHDAQVQQVFGNTARDYYAVIAGLANIQATRSAEDAARRGLEIASTRVKDGAAAISDQWQAQTSYAQATYNRAAAEGDYKKELGTLAIEIGLPPNTSIQINQNLDGVLPNTDFVRDVADLLKQAQQTHPSLAAARAQVAAARAHADMVRDQGRPTISLVGRRSLNNQPVSLGTGLGYVGARTNDAYIGLELDVPVFEGFGRGYQIKAAEAEVERQQGSLNDTEQQVAQGVWNSYQALQIETENLRNTDTVLSSAKLAEQATQYRYQKGAGSILELLNTQNALANARLQYIIAQANWRNARLQLASSLGKLDNLDLVAH
jgi:outer membrane protein